MKKFLLMSPFILVAVAACSTSEKQIVDVLKKNPQLVFNVIEENPEQFIDVVNNAARNAQMAQQKKQAAAFEEQQKDQIKNPLKPSLSEKRMLFGSKKGKIIIVEYADFQCPACRMAHSNLKEIKAKYKDNIQIYYKNMPLDFHKMAYPAAVHYEAVFKQSSEKALKFYNYLFENQGQLQSDSFLKEAAKKVGVDAKKLAIDIQSQEIKELIASDMCSIPRSLTGFVSDTLTT